MSKAGEAKERANRWRHLGTRINGADTALRKLHFAHQLFAAAVVANRAYHHPLVEDLTRRLVEAARTIEEEART